MAHVIKSVSLTPEESEFLDSYNLSPTELLKQALWSMKGQIKVFANEKIEKLAKLLQEATNENVRLLEELKKYKNKNREPGNEKQEASADPLLIKEEHTNGFFSI